MADEEPTDRHGHKSNEKTPDTGTEPDEDDSRDASGSALLDPDSDGDSVDLAEDLVPLLRAARTARDELIHEGSTVGRDALAARLRRNGIPILNTRVSELLAVLKAETENGARPKASVDRRAP